MKLLLLSCLYCFSAITALPQRADMKLFAAGNVKFIRPKVIGQVGSHIMVYDDNGGWPSLIYTFDSAYRLVNITKEYISDKVPNFRISGSSVYLTWRNWSKDSLSISLTKLDELGNTAWFSHNKYYFPSAAASAPTLVTDARNNYYLYYSLVTDREHKDHIRAVLMDTAWNEVKSGFYHIPYERNFSTMTSPVVDIAGNIHIGVYDRLSNYHLSSSLTLYTLPAGSDSILRADFTFDKLKFHDMTFHDDTLTHALKMLGYYYDGQEKIKQGIASLSFPYADGDRQPQTQFYPFPDELPSLLRSNLRYARKKDNPTENLRIKEIFERDGQLIVANWLVDMPQYQLTKDKDLGREMPVKKQKKETEVRSYHPPGVNPAIDAILNNSVNFNAPAAAPIAIDPTRPGALVPRNYVPVFTSPVGQQSKFTQETLNPNEYSTATRELDPNDYAMAAQELARFSENRNAGKLTYFTIDRQGNYQTSIVPNQRARVLSAGLNNYPLVHNGNLIFLDEPLPPAQSSRQIFKRHMLIASYNKQGIASTLADFETANTVFYKPAELSAGRYVGAYCNFLSGASGLVLWAIENTQGK